MLTSKMEATVQKSYFVLFHQQFIIIIILLFEHHFHHLLCLIHPHFVGHYCMQHKPSPSKQK